MLEALEAQAVMLVLTETTLRFLELELQQSHQLAVAVEVITPPAAHKMVVLEAVELLTQTMGLVLEHLVKATTVVTVMLLLLTQGVAVAQVLLEPLVQVAKAAMVEMVRLPVLPALLFITLVAVAALEMVVLQLAEVLAVKGVEVMAGMATLELTRLLETEQQIQVAEGAVNVTQRIDQTEQGGLEVLVL